MQEINLASTHSSDRADGKIYAIVVHATAGTDSRDWLVKNPNGVSCHRLISKAGLIYRMVPDAKAAHHIGFSQIALKGKIYGSTTKPTNNQISLGVELENLNTGNDPYPAAQRAALGWCLQDWTARYPEALLLNHRLIDTKGKPDPAGLSMRDLYLLCAPAPAPAVPTVYSTDSPILARPAVDDTALAWAMLRLSRSTDARITDLINATIRTARGGGVDPVIALAQQAHETAATGDPYTSWWSRVPRRNLAGIGVNKETRAAPSDQPPGPAWEWAWDGVRWVKGVSFGTDDAAIVAHIGRLLAYTVPAGKETDATSALIFTALTVRGLPATCRGSAATLRDLGHGPNPVAGCGWAGADDNEGWDYGTRIAAWANRIMGAL